MKRKQSILLIAILLILSSLMVGLFSNKIGFYNGPDGGYIEWPVHVHWTRNTSTP